MIIYFIISRKFSKISSVKILCKCICSKLFILLGNTIINSTFKVVSFRVIHCIMILIS